jgi:hypothetical protein
VQIQRRYSETEIKSNFIEQKLLQLVKSSAAIALSATIHASILLGRIELASEFINQFCKNFIEVK